MCATKMGLLIMTFRKCVKATPITLEQYLRDKVLYRIKTKLKRSDLYFRNIIKDLVVSIKSNPIRQPI